MARAIFAMNFHPFDSGIATHDNAIGFSTMWIGLIQTSSIVCGDKSSIHPTGDQYCQQLVPRRLAGREWPKSERPWKTVQLLIMVIYCALWPLLPPKHESKLGLRNLAMECRSIEQQRRAVRDQSLQRVVRRAARMHIARFAHGIDIGPASDLDD